MQSWIYSDLETLLDFVITQLTGLRELWALAAASKLGGAF
jgi:hypothetical protein